MGAVCDVLHGETQGQPDQHQGDSEGMEEKAGFRLETGFHPNVTQQGVYDPGHPSKKAWIDKDLEEV